MGSKKIVMTGLPKLIRRDLLFQSAVHWAEEGFKVLFLKKSKFETIPSTGHGPQIPSSEVLSKIRIMYLESMEEALKCILDVLTFRDTAPRVILVEELEEYLSEDIRERDHQLAQICATLCFVAESCATYYNLTTYLLVGLALPEDKIPPVILTMFNCVWTFNSETCLLSKALPLDDMPRVQLSLGPRSDDGAFVLKAVNNLFAGD
ncbi:uncharacterized protein LOC128994816 [Macrosteles quadrilineatus]|uniref:uncharacterized protein LOC128994816 n=1 Tax=Macrosteles quadrilineatus TaxID=74068 RepID=UPI0023E1B7A6|nr:uncharacterized protein LOC128994816 [Macrosteles quadrilineatus]